MSLFVEKHPDGNRLKVSTSSFQYQETDDPDPGAWIFRYDYLREPRAGEPHPPTHLQVNATLNVEGVLPANRPLSRLHFPTRRMPLEGVIRLLIEEFGVGCAQPPEVARAILAEAEVLFKEIAYEPPLGPVR